MSPITIPDYVTELMNELERVGYAAFVVGGCVRDSLLGRAPADWDVCTDATPDEMLRVFRKRRVFETGLRHGTLTVRSRHHNVEVTTFRTDGEYTDNRHPDAVHFVARVEDDLARRDFTINAMAYNPTTGLVDIFGGQSDLRNHLLRCVGEPDVRFNEDGLRILRALRFAARFGFGIETETAYSVRRNRLLLENISAERIYKELQGILTACGAGDMLTAFPEVFAVILPELAPLVGTLLPDGTDRWVHTVRAVCASAAGDFPFRFAMLLHQLPPRAVRSALHRLKCGNAVVRFVITLLQHLPDALPTTRPQMRRLIGAISKPMTEQLLMAHRIMVTLQHRPQEPVRAARFLLAEVWDTPPAYNIRHLAINGKDLLRLDLSEGPLLGQILAQLLTEVQDETLPNSRDALLTRAAQICRTSVEP